MTAVLLVAAAAFGAVALSARSALRTIDGQYHRAEKASS